MTRVDTVMFTCDRCAVVEHIKPIDIFPEGWAYVKLEYATGEREPVKDFCKSCVAVVLNETKDQLLPLQKLNSATANRVTEVRTCEKCGERYPVNNRLVPPGQHCKACTELILNIDSAVAHIKSVVESEGKQ